MKKLFQTELSMNQVAEIQERENRKNELTKIVKELNI